MVSIAATDISNLPKTLKKHSTCDLHIHSLEAAEIFKRVMTGAQKDICASMSSSYNAIVEKNRLILLAIVETVILCGRQNLSLRGHEEERGNFVALLHHQAKHNILLADHLKNGDPRTKYTSNKIQNELVAICGDEIKTKIINQCNQAPFLFYC